MCDLSVRGLLQERAITPKSNGLLPSECTPLPIWVASKWLNPQNGSKVAGFRSDPTDPTVTSHLHSNTRYCVTLKTCRTCRIMRLQWLQCAPGVECNGWSQPFPPSIHILSRPQTTMAKATSKSNCADWYYLIDVNVRFIETVETGISWKSWFPIGIRTSFFGGKDFEDLACKMLRISSNVGNVGPLKTHSLLHTAQDNKKSQSNQRL